MERTWYTSGFFLGHGKDQLRKRIYLFCLQCEFKHGSGHNMTIISIILAEQPILSKILDSSTNDGAGYYIMMGITAVRWLDSNWQHNWATLDWMHQILAKKNLLLKIISSTLQAIKLLQNTTNLNKWMMRIFSDAKACHQKKKHSPAVHAMS